MPVTESARLWLWLAAALGLGLLLPNHYSPWLSVHQEMAAGFAFAPLLAWGVFQKGRAPALATGAAGLAVVPLLQWMAGRLYFATDAWMAMLYLAAFALAVHTGAGCARARMQQPAAVRLAFLAPLWSVLLGAALVSVGLAVHQWLLPSYQGIYVVEIPPGWRPFANLAQPNQLATLLLLGLSGLMFLWQLAHVRTSVAVATALWLVFGLAMTGSRSVVLALIWLVPLYFWSRKRSVLRLTPFALGILVGAYFLCGWLWRLASQALLLDTPDGTVIDRMGTLGVRKAFWMQMLDAVAQHPWWGWGWGQISFAQTATALNYPATHTSFDSAHNLFLDFALWAGLPVAVAVFLGLAWWGGRQVHQARDPLAWSCLVAVGFVFSHAMVEYPLYYAYFLLPVGFLMGVLSGVRASATLVASHWQRSVVVLIGAMTGALFLRVVWEYFPFEADWQLMRFQEAHIGSRAVTKPPPATVLTSLRDFLYWSRVEPAPGMEPRSIARIGEISERFAYAAPMYRFALVQGLNGRANEAQKTLARLCRMQTEAACQSARKDWEQKGAGEFPQLATIPFPAEP